MNISLDVLYYRFKSARLFGRNLCVWDFFLKVTMDFNQSIAHHLQASSAANQGSKGCLLNFLSLMNFFAKLKLIQLSSLRNKRVEK